MHLAPVALARNTNNATVPCDHAACPGGHHCYRRSPTGGVLAGVAELVDAAGLGPAIARCGGSSPFARTNAIAPCDGAVSKN